MTNENVLLLNLSMLSIEQLEPSQYSFFTKDKEQETLTGWLTNEAPAKVLIYKLKEIQRRLDRIVMIESDTVRTAQIGTSHAVKKQSNLPLSEESTVADYFREVITAYALDIDPETYKNKKIEFLSVPIADEPDKDEVTKVVLQAASYAEGCHLHIDYNGGPRQVAFMQLAIANVLHQRGAKVENVWTMLYKKGEVTKVMNQSYLFDSFDFVSSLHECVKLGRIQSLKTHFQYHLTPVANRLLDDLSEFIKNLQLCRTSLIMEKRTELKQQLENYYQTTAITEEPKGHEEQLFCFVVQDILREYNELLTADLPGIIRWCLKKEFMMQALTFCSEQLPGYFWETGLITPTEAEKKEFDTFLELAKDNKNLKAFYMEAMNEKSASPNSYKNRAYCWMNKYLYYSKKYGNDPKYSFTYPETMSLYKLSTPSKVGGIPDKLVCYVSEEKYKPRVQQRNNGMKQLKPMIKLYYEMKDQRNFSNHADDMPQVERRKEPLSYEDLDKSLYRLLTAIDNLTK